MKKLITFCFCILQVLISNPIMGDSITAGTWNLEHLGSPGRGLGYRDLPLRSHQDLAKIARLIQSEKIDLLALQEIAITHRDNASGDYQSTPLNILCNLLGESWRYRIAPPSGSMPSPESVHNMQNAYIWDSSKLRGLRFFPVEVENVAVGSKNLFDRIPWAGWFETLNSGEEGNDFLLVNLHLTSGQNNDENHLAAMIMVERNLYSSLREIDITESDRAFLGDFNDNPWAVNDQGQARYMDLLYRYMDEKGFQDLLTEEDGFTRINSDMNSAIDHVLINRSLMRHLESDQLRIYRPQADNLNDYQQWREVYSDHFPLLFSIKVSRDDDKD